MDLRLVTLPLVPLASCPRDALVHRIRYCTQKTCAGVRSAKPVYKQAPQIKTDHGLARSTLVAHIYEERDPFGFLLLSPPPPHTAHSTHSTSSHSRGGACAHINRIIQVSSTECVISTVQSLGDFVPYSN